MAQILYLLSFFLSLTTPILGAQPSNFKALVAPITQPNSSSFVYAITLNQNENLVIDIESAFSWHRCPQGSPLILCHTPQCTAAQVNQPTTCQTRASTTPTPSPSPAQIPCRCSTLPYNPITKSCGSSQLTYTNVSIASTNGHNPLAKVNYNKIFISCAPKSLLMSLPKGTSGFASLSKGSLSLVSQFSNLHVPKIFGMCLGDPGVAFFGEGPFFLLPPPGRNVTQFLSFTPLLKNPSDSLGYYIGIKGIAVNLQAVNFLKGMVPFEAKLSSVIPFTTLRSSIYRAFFGQFAMATSKIPRVPKVAPFDLCLNTTNLGSTRVGLPVPQIDLELTNGANWTIFGANSMIQVSADVACLAFVDGGENAKQAMVIGSYQMQNNFLLFDLVKSRLGFSSTLFFFQTTCSNFNFTSGV